jgi:hypothetical protein
MAWTSPATWNAGAILTAAQLNTQLRDNLAYLKGSAGTIAFDSGATFASTITATGTNGDAIVARSGGAGNFTSIAIGRTADEGRFAVAAGAGQFFSDAAAGDTVFRVDSGSQKLLMGAGSGATTLALTSARAGVRTINPQGLLHGTDGVGGFLHWSTGISGSDLGGSSQAVTANGVVTYGIFAMLIARSSAGSTAASTLSGGGGTAIGLGGTQTIACGADTLTLGVNASGGIFVQRTAGGNTHKVALWITYL